MFITSLVDDYCPQGALRGEHGFSLLVTKDSVSLLFDCGQTNAFIQNAESLDIDLSRVSGVILSHGHYDHGGGLSALARKISIESVKLYVGKGIDLPRVSSNGARRKSIGLPPESIGLLKGRAREVTGLTQIAEGFFLLPHAGNPGMVSSRLHLITPAGERQDEFDDELSLIYVEGDGLCVITGCAHRGIGAIVRSALEAFPGKRLRAIVGGFHLVDASAETLRDTVEELRELGPAALYCAHCTGLDGYAALSRAMPGKVEWLSCGKGIHI
jgi:7,8-dihydropterin-6-yl-methyl-4-(beta-D-ribofuranosyl)aminobenzene 5'-phosphate synthase